MANNSTLRALVDLRMRMQKNRIQFGNRISAVERGVDAADEHTQDVLSKYLVHFDELEKEATRDIHEYVQDIEIVERMTEVKGIGDTLAAMIVAMVDIEKADHVSNLWRYAGFAVGDDGKRERPTKGERLHYNARLKTVLYNAGVSMIRCGSPYTEVYYAAKEYYANKVDDKGKPWTKAHIDAAARRKMIKVFLQNLWLVWRTISGLPVTEPYVQDKLGHNHILRPQHFGWSDFGEG